MTLENLFNTLCERGWKPFGRFDKLMGYGQSDSRKVFQFGVLGEYEYYLRDIVSIESGLWQFCVDNGMVEMAEGFYRQNIFPLDSIEYEYVDYQYWIIESALCDEDKLKQFLLDNINVEGH